METKLLTVAQTAQLKGVSLSAVYKAISEGRLPSLKIVGKTVVKEADANSWLPTGRGKGVVMPAGSKVKISESQKLRWKLRKGEVGLDGE